MTYLLSSLTDTSSSEAVKESLCYYINNTKCIQNIKIISEHRCLFERIIFSGERMLFEAPLEAYVKIHSFLLDGIQTTEIECQWLYIAEK